MLTVIVYIRGHQRGAHEDHVISPLGAVPKIAQKWLGHCDFLDML